LAFSAGEAGLPGACPGFSDTLLVCRVLFVLVVCAACGREAAGPATLAPRITLHVPQTGQPAFVEVTGIGARDLSNLRDARLSADQWQSLFTVRVGDAPSVGALPPVQGRYAITPSAITFTPLFPFDLGRAYQVAFDPAHVSGSRPVPVVTAIVRLPAVTGSPTTSVIAVHPSSGVLPDNTLRLYVEFSAPMGRAGALDFVRLLDEGGREVATPFLPVQADFWNPAHTRYTLFFDPGRVKQGILPNQQLGRPLRAGHTYTLQISADWPDAHGQPLKAPYRREFRVAQSELQPIAPAGWRVAPPAPRTRDPLVVTFPRPLDHGLLARALGVQDGGHRTIDGEITLEAADTRWLFRPAAEWAPGAYQLVALSILEDPAGNRIGRAFEVDMTRTDATPAVDAYRLSFRVAEPGS
jgi:hypothetical protein